MAHEVRRRATPVELISILEAYVPQLPQSPLAAQKRLVNIALICEGLEAHGIDGDSLIRYGMPSRIGASLVVALLTEPRGSTKYEIDTDAWREVLQIPHALLPGEGEISSPDLQEIQKQYHRIRPSVLRWIEAAPMEEVLSLTAPTSANLASYEMEAAVPSEVTDAYEWLWERSTQSDVSRWPTSALFLEFRWRQRGAGAVFPDTALAGAGPEPELINYEIAKRVVEAPEDNADHYDPLVWQLQDQAKAFLKQDRYAEASALFEFYHRLHPDSREAMNNLAFCNLPVDPELALHYLELAEKAGYSPLAINIYNQCCCLVQLGRHGEAIDKAEYYWQRQRETEKVSGYLWRRDEDDEGWELYSEPDAALAVASIAIAASEFLGREDRATKWSARRSEITSAWVLPGDDDLSGAA